MNLDEIIIPEYETAAYTVPFAIDALKGACEQQGTVVSLSNEAPAYAGNEMLGRDETIEKTLQVYLPYGYDEGKQYPVLYLLHGTGGKDTYWFFDGEEGTATNVLDNMIAQGLCEPLIVVCPEYPSELKGRENKIKDELVEAYAAETGDSCLKVRNDLWTEFSSMS